MKLFFLFGDLITTASVGAISGALCALCFSESWPMFLAMFPGMAIGMVVGFGLASVAAMWFGAFEVSVPSMLGGMLAGMVVAMVASMRPVLVGEGWRVGVAVALVALLFTYLANALLRGEQQVERPRV